MVTNTSNAMDSAMDSVFEILSRFSAADGARGGQIGVVAGGAKRAWAIGARNAAGDPATTGTTFPIASLSKAFTGFLIGQLKDRGVLDFDDRVRKFLPDFQKRDEYAADCLTVRDCLCHRSGLARSDLAWARRGGTTADTAALIPHLPMAVGLRDKAVYSNIMYALLSEIVLSATGKPLAQNFKELIFDPLGMRHTCCGALVADTEITWACPYREEEGKAIDLPLFPTDNIGGGGFVNSTSDDMLRWLEMLLAAERGARGRAPGARLIAPETFQECVSPQIRYATLTLNWDDVFAMRSYGFGWILETYRGRRVWRHGGGIEGFFGCALLFPDEGIGIAALTNTNGRHFCESMSFEVADRLLGVGGIDWSARLAREREIEAARVAGLRDSDLGPASGAERSLAPAACCGRYTHPGFGEMRVFQRGEALWLGCAALELPLCHHGGDCFYLGTAELTVPATPIRFTASGGSAVALRAVLEPMPPRDEVVFDRVS